MSEAIRRAMAEIDKRAEANSAEDARTALRDQFAMAALTGLISNYGDIGPPMAAVAYSFADEMLASRKESSEI